MRLVLFLAVGLASCVRCNATEQNTVAAISEKQTVSEDVDEVKSFFFTLQDRWCSCCWCLFVFYRSVMGDEH